MKIDYRNKEIINGNIVHRTHDANFDRIEYISERNELKLFLVCGFFGEDFEITFKNLLSVSVENGNLFENISEDISIIFLNKRNINEVPLMYDYKYVPLEKVLDCCIELCNTVRLNIACEEIEFTIKETELSRRLAEENQ